MGSKGDVKHSVCVFFVGMGSNLAGVLVFSNLTLTRMIYLCGPILGNDPILWLQTMSC